MWIFPTWVVGMCSFYPSLWSREQFGENFFFRDTKKTYFLITKTSKRSVGRSSERERERGEMGQLLFLSSSSFPLSLCSWLAAAAAGQARDILWNFSFSHLVACRKSPAFSSDISRVPKITLVPPGGGKNWRVAQTVFFLYIHYFWWWPHYSHFASICFSESTESILNKIHRFKRKLRYWMHQVFLACLLFTLFLI